MTSRQQRRLELAERVCDLAARDLFAGLGDEPWHSDILRGLAVYEDEVRRSTEKSSPAIERISEFTEQLKAAIVAWMKSVGRDPGSDAKGQAQQNAMALAKAAYGLIYEADITQGSEAKYLWPERTAVERADDVAADIASGKISGFEEMRIAIAGEILEAESVVREPFIDIARTMVRKMNGDVGDDAVSESFTQMLRIIGAWIPECSPEALAAECPDLDTEQV